MPVRQVEFPLKMQSMSNKVKQRITETWRWSVSNTISHAVVHRFFFKCKLCLDISEPQLPPCSLDLTFRSSAWCQDILLIHGIALGYNPTRPFDCTIFSSVSASWRVEFLPSILESSAGPWYIMPFFDLTNLVCGSSTYQHSSNQSSLFFQLLWDIGAYLLKKCI